VRVVITGASGNVGRLATGALERDHDLVLLDRREREDRNVVRVDLAVPPGPLRPPWRPAWDRCFERADVVVHLAGRLHPAGWGLRGWPRIRRSNIDATWNVLSAAARHGVPRVVYGSSTFAVRAEMFRRDGDDTRLGDVPPRPLMLYGLSKAFGETAGRMFVDERRLHSFVAVRIGYCPQDGVPPDNPWLRRLWTGRGDLARLLRRCVESELEGFHVVYGVSGPDSPFDLRSTRALLGWDPEEGDESSRPRE